MTAGDDLFAGSGWAFPVRLDDDGAVARSTDGEQAIRDAVWTVVATAPGERLMRPDYGCGLGDHVFALTSAGTAGEVARAVTDALADWEPRIDVLDVTAEPDATDPRLLAVTISFQVRRTNSRLNLVYPFYLE